MLLEVNVKNKKGSHRAYNVEISAALGLVEAVLLFDIRYWILNNAKKPEQYKDGKVWMYHTSAQFHERHKDIPQATIKRALVKLRDCGVLTIGLYNKWKTDRTIWYSFRDEEMWLENYDNLTEEIIKKSIVNFCTTHCSNMNNPTLPDEPTIQIIKKDNIKDTKQADKKDCLQKESIITKKTGVKKSALKINHIPVSDDSLPGGKSAQEIIDMVKTKAVEELDDLNYLFEITPFQILNPKHPDVVNASYKKVKLNHITGDLAKLYRRLVIKNHPNMGTLPEINIKDYGLIKNTMIKLSGSVELLRLIIIHWTTFKSLVEAEHGAKIKDKYPNLLVITKYAGIAASSVFLGKTSKGVSPDLFANAMTLEKALK